MQAGRGDPPTRLGGRLWPPRLLPCLKINGPKRPKWPKWWVWGGVHTVGSLQSKLCITHLFLHLCPSRVCVCVCASSHALVLRNDSPAYFIDVLKAKQLGGEKERLDRKGGSCQHVSFCFCYFPCKKKAKIKFWVLQVKILIL